MRRLILIFLLLSCVLMASCQTGTPLPPTAEPTATAVPINAPAHEVAAAFLQAWQAGQYEAMYALCSTAAQAAFPYSEFLRIYQEIGREATIIAVEPTLLSVLQQGVQAQAAFSLHVETSFVGDFAVENELPLIWEAGRWAVVWSKQCIFRELIGKNLVHLVSRPTVRANIYDINGKGLAIKKDLITVGVVPGQIKDEAAVLARLSLVTGMAQPDIKTKYQDQPATWFIPIADISVEKSQQHYNLLISEPGIVLREKSVRSYRDPSAAPHLIGFMGGIPEAELAAWQSRGYAGDELIGRTGIEGWGETWLAGQRGGVLTIITPEGQIAATLARREATPARSVYLTLDYDFQRKVEDLLGERKGAVVVLNVNDGRVLAMATWPRFDSNRFAEGIDSQTWATLVNDPNRPLMNRAIQGQYAPGSTFKVVTMGTAMERSGVPTSKTYHCTGSWNVFGWPMTCWLKTGHGTVDLITALTVSCDVAFYQMGYDLAQIDKDALSSYARSFGLGTVTGLGQTLDGRPDPLGETPGLVPDDAWKRRVLGEGWSTGDTVNMSIGQGFLLTTPLQMARLIAAIGNGGILYRPQLVWKMAGVGDQPEITFQPDKVGRLPITPDTLKAIRQGLENVTTKPRGTATHRFVNFPYPVAGKTGTSQNEGELPHAWFIGYLPANQPEIAIAVLLENIGEGSTFAAPLFRQVAAAYYGIEDFAPQVEGQGD